MLLLSTASLKGYGLHKIFSFAASAGFDGVCLDLDPTQFDTLNAGYIAELSAMYQLPIRSIAAYERKMDTETVDDVIAMARSLGAESVFFSPPHRLDRDASWFSTYLPQIAESVTDVNLAVINMEPKTILFFIPEYKDATLESIRKVTGKTALSISNVDPETGVDLMRTFALLGNSIVNVFL